MDIFILLGSLVPVGLLLYGITQLPYFLKIKSKVENSIKKIPITTNLDNILPEIDFKFPKSMPKQVKVDYFYYKGRKIIYRRN